MKSKLLLLLKTNIINTYKIKSRSKKSWIGIIILALYVIAVLGASLGMYMNKLYTTFNEMGMAGYYIIALFSIASMFSFFFSIFSAKSGLFDNKDNDLLLALPVSRKDILTSRLLTISIYNTIIGLFFIIPGVIVYLMHTRITVMFIVSLIFLILLFSIIPTILASLFGYLVATLTSRTNNKSMFELLFYTLFIAIYLFTINSGGKILSFIINNKELLNVLSKTLFLPYYLLSKTIETNNILYILGFISINIICLYLFVSLLNKSYLKIITKLNSHNTKSNYKIQTLQTKTKSKALLEKEFKRYFSSAIYVFNTIFGVILILIVSIGSFFYSSEKIAALLNFNDLTPFGLVFSLLLFVISLTVTTNSCISIEKENFWIMKMIPVETKKIFNAKIMLNRIILIPFAVLSLIIFNINSFITLNEMLLLIVLTIVYGFFISNFGLITNLLFPKFDAPNDNVIVKQSAASFIGIFGGLSFFALILVFSNMYSKSNILILLVSIIISIILLVISKLIINSWGIKRWNNL